MNIKNYFIQKNVDEMEISKIEDIFEEKTVKDYFENLQKIDKILKFFLDKFWFLMIWFFIIYIISKEKIYTFNWITIDLNYLILFFYVFLAICLILKIWKFILKNYKFENEIYVNLLKIFSKKSDFSYWQDYIFPVWKMKQYQFKNTFFIEMDFWKIFFQDDFRTKKHFVKVEFFNVEKTEKIEKKWLNIFDFLTDNFFAKDRENIENSKYDLFYENKNLYVTFYGNLVKDDYEIKNYLDFFIFVKKVLVLISDFEKNIK